MPTYTYKCKSCEHHFDIRQKMTDEKLTFCPVCNKEKLEKVITATQAPVLKGGGWTGQKLTR